MLMAQGSTELDVVSGYVGKVENVHIFQSNATSVGAPGSTGVQTENLGVGARDTYSSTFFGRSAVGVGYGMPMQVRTDSSGTFGRQTRYIWLMHAGYVQIDVDPDNSTPANNQQLRVIELRTTETEV